DPVVKRSELVFGRLKRQKLAELRLPARSLEEHHQIACHRQRRRAAKVLLDQSQGEVDPGGDTCRSPNRNVLHENWIEVDADGGKTARKFCTESPMCDGSPAVKHARCGEEKSAGTDRCGTT